MFHNASPQETRTNFGVLGQTERARRGAERGSGLPCGDTDRGHAGGGH